MKELSIEEKAKAYDEAIERAKKIHNEHKAQPFDVMLKVFPELKESEGESIRKELIEYFEHYSGGDNISIKFSEWIAWLEKQGELVNSLSKGLDNAHERIDGLIQKNNSLIEQLEKQGEQKPAWSEEDDEMLDSIIEEVRYIGDFPDYPTKEENELYDECLAKVEWLKSLKERYT